MDCFNIRGFPKSSRTRWLAIWMTDNQAVDDWVFVPRDDAQEADRRNVGPGSASLLPLSKALHEMMARYQSHPSPSLAVVGSKSGNNAVPSKMVKKGDACKVGGPPLQQTQSPLFRVPLETRLRIYHFVFTLPPNTQMSWGRMPSRTTSTHRFTVLAYLETCRLALLEAETIMFTINRLRFRETVLDEHTCSRRRNAIHSLEISSSHPGVVTSQVRMLRFVPNVRSLHVVFPCDNLRFVDVSTWKIMLPSMELALRELKCLQEVKLVWKEDDPDKAEVGEIERGREIAQIAERLAMVVRQS